MNIYILEKGLDEEIFKIIYCIFLMEVLKEVLGLSELVFILCGGGDVIVFVCE